MFANRFTAFIDACSLAGTLKRNFLLTLAEAEFFRLRWSVPVLDETQRAIEQILQERGVEDASARAARARASVEEAFEEAVVHDFEAFLQLVETYPMPATPHVLAAAVKTQAFTIVTDNLKDVPQHILAALNIEARRRARPTRFLRTQSPSTWVVPLLQSGRCGSVSSDLFVRDLPRLSVDIDLTFLPAAPRPASLAAIDAALKRMAATIRRRLGPVPASRPSPG